MKLLSLLTSALLLSLAAPVAAQTWEGRVSNVRDGDTIDVAGVPHGIRLFGVDAPEKAQGCTDVGGKPYLCGSRAGDALASLIGRNGRVTCEHVDWDRYGRSSAVCRANGVDLGRRMVELGWATDYARYSKGRYADAQARAKTAGVGIWAGGFEDPADVRAAGREGRTRARVPAASSGSGCDIKGNVSRDGRRIYHSPGQRDYDRTAISESEGERWFCSAAEAEAAGWTAAKR